MAERDPKTRAGSSPTPEAHGNREARAVAASSAPEGGASAAAPGLDDFNRVRATLEALLLASTERLDRAMLLKCLPEEDHPLINGALENLKLEYSGAHRGIHLVEVAGGFQLRTNPAFRDSVRQMYAATPRKLSRAALETLAIVAYRQPLTRADIEEIRGVDSSGVLRTLEEHDLVQTVGRLDDIGRPHILGTTPRFLEFFGLSSLEDLPNLSADELQALDELYADEMAGEEEGGSE
ncbi:SMC-Scp complex subunit ScpB [Bradymonas sediminis]|uniref:SMC-Scp complex subunit ScpB n=1 Tax=Bradymonas sediminis TaxID=1548548 RepID=A0A2Z4FPZ2_9DELT|nr:SMC-Scp complex subunit ScpB [Bradymonas sediminis]AWV90726.1 SMC-Scp complex subunit ScpB [Bradymonas sediminis]TDP62632.1 condensin subunit ScpB [Bradymonas sediminis]